MFLFCLVFAMSLCASVYMCFVVTCWERADLLALVCGVYCESVTFPLVSWVRCGTWLYRFLIFAPLLTSKWCSVSSLTLIEYSSDKQRLWSDCAYAQAGLSLCWSHIPHCWKSHVMAQMFLRVVEIQCLTCQTCLVRFHSGKLRNYYLL